MKDRIDGLKWGGVWLLVQRGDATPSDGHAIDHIGWRTPNLAAKTAELKAQTVEVHDRAAAPEARERDGRQLRVELRSASSADSLFVLYRLNH